MATGRPSALGISGSQFILFTVSILCTTTFMISFLSPMFIQGKVTVNYLACKKIVGLQKGLGGLLASANAVSSRV
jgi:hypothetical protein